MEGIVPVAILIFGAFFVLRLLIGKETFSRVSAHWIFEISRALVTLPFKIMAFFLRRRR